MKTRKKAPSQLVFTWITLTTVLHLNKAIFPQQKYNISAELLIQFAIIEA